ncbi:MAG: twin-arginine translocase TatA/TatE family subunit [Propionibacteriaceae bacterium]|nr:twin-arginine translocase TatA/TatE family subunit [Propionibacteriaceae bacterium]
MTSLGGWAWLILLLVAVLIFAGSRLPGIGKPDEETHRERKGSQDAPNNSTDSQQLPVVSSMFDDDI